jgi:hypothetical protein
VYGDPAASQELEDDGWHPIGHQAFASFRNVTRFMLARAIALRAGTGSGEAPLFYWAKNAAVSAFAARRSVLLRRRSAGPGRSAGTLSPSSIAGQSQSTVWSVNSPSSRSACRAAPTLPLPRKQGREWEGASRLRALHECGARRSDSTRFTREKRRGG